MLCDGNRSTTRRKDFGGFRLPTRIEAGNFFETDDYFAFFKARVTSVRFPGAGATAWTRELVRSGSRSSALSSVKDEPRLHARKTQHQLPHHSRLRS